MSTQILPRTFPTPTVTGTSGQVCPPNPARSALVVFNPNATATLAVSALDTAAVINGQGSITIPPGVGVTLSGWTAGLNAVTDASAVLITVLEF